jgi:hypothetical protein
MRNHKSSLTSNLLLSVSLSSLLASGLPLILPAQAAVSSADIVNVVEKAKILSTGTRVAAALNGTEAYISTYKNAKATDNDCKIEAVLIAKTVMDLSPTDITRVTVYFYSSANINKRKFVTVTAGDVKAFGSGQLGQEQLLSSLTVKDEEVNDPAARLNTYLQQRETLRNKRTYDTKLNGSTMVVTADIDPQTSERDLKFEAFRIAERALDAGSNSGAKSVTVCFTDAATRGTVQQVTFEESQLKSIGNSITSALNSIQMAAVASKIDAQSLSTGDGDEKESRDKILTMIKNLDKNGVGVQPFLKSFFDIEALAATDGNPALKPAIARLTATLQEQEARSKNAKDFKPVGKEQPKVVEEKAPEHTEAPSTKKTKISRWAGGNSAFTDAEILSDVDRAIDAQVASMGGLQQAEQNRNFAKVLYRAYEVLHNNNREDDANRIMKRYAELKTRNGW